MKKCGTCKFWSANRNIVDEATFCDWPCPELPFWASIISNGDHSGYTEADDGSKCRVWEQKPSEDEREES